MAADLQQNFIKLCSIFIVFAFVAGGCNAPAGKSHYVLAERLFSDHKYAAAVQEFQKIIDSDPKGPLSQQALFRSAVIQFLYLDNYTDSIKNFRKFISISQNQDLVFQAEKNIGEVYFTKLEEFRLAAEQYRQLIEKYPNSPEKDYFMLRLAKSFYSTLDFAKAIQVYQEIVKAFPNSSSAAEALYQIGNTYYTKGEPDLAIKAFEQVLKDHPTSPHAVFAQFGIGNCYEEKDRPDEALTIYSKILDKHPARNVVEAKIRRLRERKARSH